jgi:hypothetical protein
VDSKNNKLKVHCFQDGKIITNAYKGADTVPVAVLPGFSIALEQVFAE